MSHLLHVDGISSEGSVEFDVSCERDERGLCVYSSADQTECVVPAGEEFEPICWVREEFSQIGAEIIRGEAYGSGPWPIKLSWEGNGEYAESYIDLLPEEEPLSLNGILSV